MVSFLLNWQQIKNPDISIAIFEQNRVYGCFSATFVTVLFGTFFKDVKITTVFIANVSAIVIHLTIY
jgi:sodium/pantothenate symporter